MVLNKVYFQDTVVCLGYPVWCCTVRLQKVFIPTYFVIVDVQCTYIFTVHEVCVVTVFWNILLW
jgi:hypothetical protein